MTVTKCKRREEKKKKQTDEKAEHGLEFEEGSLLQ